MEKIKVWGGYGRPGLRVDFALFFGFILVLLSGFLGCGKMQPAYCGVFVSDAKGEMSISRDTLVIEKNERSALVLIHRKTAYRLIRDGKLGNWQQAKQDWRAKFDGELNMLLELRYGKVLTFDADMRGLSIGKRRYSRLAD